jgi:hypothetical protein
MNSAVPLIALLLVAACNRSGAPVAAPAASTIIVETIEMKPAYESVNESDADLCVVVNAYSLSGAGGDRILVFLKKMPEPNDGDVHSGVLVGRAHGRVGVQSSSLMMSGGPGEGGVVVDLTLSWISSVGGYSGEASGRLFVPWMGQAEKEFDPEFIVSARFVTPPNFDK